MSQHSAGSRVISVLAAVLAGTVMGLGVIGFSLAPAAGRTPNIADIPSGMADLVGFVEWSPLHPSPTDTLVITYGVSNIGTAAAIPQVEIVAGLYFGLPTTPTMSTPYSHSGGTGLPIAAGQRRIMAVLTGIFAVTGTVDVPLWVWADVTNDVSESNESNNVSLSAIQPSVRGVSDAYEPDDACVNSRSILPGVPYAHTLWPVGDEDWVQFQVVGGTEYRILAEANGVDSAPSARVILDCDGPTTIEDAASINGSQILWTALTNGNAYVNVHHRLSNYGPNTAYTLTITALNDCVAYDEPNDQCEMAAQISVGDASSVGRLGSFCRPNDSDWLKFEGKAGVSYRIHVQGVPGSGAHPNINAIERADCGSAPAFGDGSDMVYPVDSEGPVFVQVANRDATSYGPGTDYTLSVTVEGCGPDIYEPNDSYAAARSIPIGAAVESLNACPANDQDWFAFSALPDVAYSIETSPQPGSAGDATGDTVLCLYTDQATAPLRCDDDSGPGLGARLSYSTATSTTVHLQVRQYDPRIAGPATRYALSVRTTPCDPDRFEPNDAMLSATSIVSGTSLGSTLCPAGDRDWFTFTVPTGTYALLTSDLGYGADTTLSLFDKNGALLAYNDDYSKTLASRLIISATRESHFYAMVAPRLGASIGGGVQYSLTLQAYDSTPDEQVTPDQVLLNPPTASSQVNTLIVTNRARLAALYGEISAMLVMSKLTALAHHSEVNGELINVDLNETVRQAYNEWDTESGSPERAETVATAISNLILTTLGTRPSMQYLIIVGDDRVVPFHRVKDPSHRFPESEYTMAPSGTPAGDSLRAGYYLTDDCYSSVRIQNLRAHHWCVPQLATGRLVEMPADITGLIDRFLISSVVTPTSVLVGGYDFMGDSAQYTCQRLKADFTPVYGSTSVNCALIGNNTALSTQRELQFNTQPPFLLQSFHSHADHFQQGVNITKEFVSAVEVAGAPAPPAGGVVWSPACHYGLNLPPNGSADELDFPQAYAHVGANLIANTGFGWGTSGVLGYSEEMMQYIADGLVTGNEVRLGAVLRRAKVRYYQQHRAASGLDSKVASELTLYGFPMYRIRTPGNATRVANSGNPEDAFPSVAASLPAPSFGPTPSLVSAVFAFNLLHGQIPTATYTLTGSDMGMLYMLDGRASVESGESIQPRFYYDISASRPYAYPARSVWVLASTYQQVSAFTSTLPTLVNEYTSTQVAPDAGVWDNNIPYIVGAVGDRESLVAVMGQANQDERLVRLTRAFTVEVIYSDDADRSGPILYRVILASQGATHEVTIKLKAHDVNGVQRAGVLYTDGQGDWKSEILSYDQVNQSWVGTVVANDSAIFAVQLLDESGNTSLWTNKGRYYVPLKTTPTDPWRVFIPVVN